LKKQPDLLKAPERILQDAMAGDPISGLKWTRKTIRKLAEEFNSKGYQVGHSTVPRLVRKLRYTLWSNQKRLHQTAIQITIQTG
jgi:transposase